MDCNATRAGDHIIFGAYSEDTKKTKKFYASRR